MALHLVTFSSKDLIIVCKVETEEHKIFSPITERQSTYQEVHEKFWIFIDKTIFNPVQLDQQFRGMIQTSSQITVTVRNKKCENLIVGDISPKWFWLTQLKSYCRSR